MVSPRISFGAKFEVQEAGEKEGSLLMKVDGKRNKTYLPLILSIIIPGLGQIITGQRKKGIRTLAGILLLYYSMVPVLSLTNGFFESPHLTVYYITQSWLGIILLYLWQIIDLLNKKLIKERILALFFSLIVPGSGQIMKKQIGKGMLIIIAPFLFTVVLVSSLMYIDAIEVTLFLIPIIGSANILVYVWQLFDAAYQK